MLHICEAEPPGFLISMDAYRGTRMLFKSLKDWLNRDIEVEQVFEMKGIHFCPFCGADLTKDESYE